MRLFYKPLGLIIGIALVFASFLYFGRQQGTYIIVLLSGLIIALVFYLTILFGKAPLTSKILWTGFVIVFAVIQQMIEPFTIDTSYRIYISQHENTLVKINEILMEHPGDITIYRDTIMTSSAQLTISEIEILRESREELGVTHISKSDSQIYYGLWSFIEMTLGLTYFPKNITAKEGYQHLKGNWFR